MKKKISIVILVALFVLLAGAIFAQNEADFEVGLTEDGTGIIIKKYNGKETKVRIPATIQGKPIREIGFVSFASSVITSVVIPPGVTIIGDEAFSACQKLASVTIPEGVTKIGQRAFLGCMAIKTIALPASIERIGMNAFAGCSSLTTVTIPGSVESIIFEGIVNMAFVNCNKLSKASQEALKKRGYTFF